MNEIYKKTDDYLARVEEVGGYLFVHLDVHNPSHNVIKGIQEEFQNLLDKYAEEGRDLVFAHSNHKSSVKFWDFLHPTYQVRELDDGGWVGSWETGI